MCSPYSLWYKVFIGRVYIKPVSFRAQDAIFVFNSEIRLQESFVYHSRFNLSLPISKIFASIPFHHYHDF